MSKTEIDSSGADLMPHLHKIHTTPLGILRIKRNLCLDTTDVVQWCIDKISDSKSRITGKGKNRYIHTDECIITVNIRSYTIITAHKNTAVAK